MIVLGHLWINCIYFCKAYGFFSQYHILFRTGDLYKILKLGGTNASVFDIEEMKKSRTNLFSYHGVYILWKLDNVFEDR